MPARHVPLLARKKLGDFGKLSCKRCLLLCIFFNMQFGLVPTKTWFSYVWLLPLGDHVPGFSSLLSWLGWVAEDGDTSFRSDVAGFLRFHHSYAGSWSESRPRARASSTTYYHTSMYFTYFALCLSKVSKTTRSWYTPMDQTTVETQVLAILRPAKVHKQTAGHSENRRLPW